MRPTCFELPRFLFLSFFLSLFSFLYYWHFVYSRDGGGYRFNYKIKTIGNHLAQLLINKNVSRIHKRARENKISDIFRERSRYLYFFSFSSSFFFRLSRLKFRTFFSRFTDFHHVLTIFPAFLFRFLSLRAPSRFLGFRFFSLSPSPPVSPTYMLPTDLFRIAYLLSRFACYSWYSNLLISTRIICFFAISYNFSTRFYDFFSFFLKKPTSSLSPSFVFERSSTKFCNEITKYRRPS